MKKQDVLFLAAFSIFGISLWLTLSVRHFGLGLWIPNAAEASHTPVGPFWSNQRSTAGEWVPVHSPTQDWLLDIHMIDPGNGWAVGTEGAILHYEDGAWQEVESPTTSDLGALAMYDLDRGLAIGNQPLTFLQFADGKWKVDIDPIDGIDLYSQNAVTAITDNPIRTGGIYDVAIFDDDQVIAAGGRLGLNDWATLIRLDEMEQWFSLIRHKQPFSIMGISLAQDGSGWGVGDGVILPFAEDGAVDKKPQPEAIEATLTGVATVNQDEAWAVGTRGNLAHYSNGQWQLLETSWPEVDFFDISMVNKNEGWAVGSRGTILHYDDGIWRLYAQQSPIEALFRPLFLTSVQMTAAHDGWIVGSNGTILHYQQ